MSIRDSINTSIKNIANDIASMIQSQANNTLSNLTDEGVEYIKELAEIKAGEYANQELSNLTATGLSQYNVFCVNTGEVDDNGNPAFLTITTGSIIPENPTAGNLDESQELIVQNAEDAYGDEEPVPEVDTDDNSGISLTAEEADTSSSSDEDDTDDTDENTDEDTTTATQTLSTSGSFDITTANGKIYTVTDTLTLDISDYEDGDYNVYVNPVDLTLSVKSHTLTAGSAFPSDAVSGDYLLNTSQVPYDLQEITITTETDEETGEETTTTTITKSLNEVFAGTLTISSGVYKLTLNAYNQNIIDTSATVTGDYLPLSGGTMTGRLTLDSEEIGSIVEQIKNLSDGEYADINFVADNENRVATIRAWNQDGYNSIQLGTHDESNNAPSGLTVTNTDGTVTITGVTPASSDSSTKIATTAFVKSVLSGSGYGMATYSKSSNGYIKFANGIIIQWGVTSSSTSGTITYPTAFTATPKIVANPYGSSDCGQSRTSVTWTSASTTGISWQTYDSHSLHWIAVGY